MDSRRSTLIINVYHPEHPACWGSCWREEFCWHCNMVLPSPTKMLAQACQHIFGQWRRHSAVTTQSKKCSSNFSKPPLLNSQERSLANQPLGTWSARCFCFICNINWWMLVWDPESHHVRSRIGENLSTKRLAAMPCNTSTLLRKLTCCLPFKRLWCIWKAMCLMAKLCSQFPSLQLWERSEHTCTLSND